MNPSYDDKPLSPQLIITDLDGVEKYRYEAANIFPSGTRDFDLISFALEYGINDNQGSLSFKIRDDSGNLLNTDSKKSCKIQRQWNVQLYLGQTSSTQRWFFGKILSVEVMPLSPATQEIRIFCGGWGMRTVERLTNIRRFQNKKPDGVTLDPFDSAAQATELYKDIFSDTDHYPIRSLGAEDGITLNVQDFDVKIPDLAENFQTWAHVMARLGGNTGMYYGVDYDRVAFMRQPGTVDSGFLFCEDPDDDEAEAWTASKLGIITGDPPAYVDSSVLGGFSVIAAPGAIQDNTVDINDTGSENALYDLSTKYVAARFTPSISSVSRISLKLRRRGDPQTVGDAFVRIVTDSSGPRYNDYVARVKIPAEKLAALGEIYGTFTDVTFERRPLIAGSTYYVVLEKYGTTSNHIEWEYQTGTGTYYDSSDASSWTSRTGKMSMRVYPSKNMTHICISTNALKKYGVREKSVPLRDLPTSQAARSLVFGLIDTLSMERRMITPFQIAPVTDRIPVGTYARLKTLRGLDATVDVIGVALSADANKNGLGVERIQLTCETRV
jgi:hypothetical protein